MVCIYGKKDTPVGETGVFFICTHENNKGNVCRFSKWCGFTKQYELAADKNGNRCKYFEEMK